MSQADLTRRGLLRAGAAGGLLALTGCERALSLATRELGQRVPASIAETAAAEIDPAFHLLSRAAYGPWPGDVDRVRARGTEAWLEEQLHPESIDDLACDLRARRFDTLHEPAHALWDHEERVVVEELQRATLLRAIYSQRQLQEVMVGLWTDHLNIDVSKGACGRLKTVDDREVVRPHALGRFRDLLRASALSPAMLVYLDGAENRHRCGASSASARRPRGTTPGRSGDAPRGPRGPLAFAPAHHRCRPEDRPNENYARELLELHTLGVDGGYRQEDVMEAARCLTGWRVNRRWRRGRVEFDRAAHDDGEKVVLGVTIQAGGGEGDLERLLDVVAAHPSTARHVARKLCRRFVQDDPPTDLVASIARVFTTTSGDLRACVRAVLGSDAFAASRGARVKRPLRFVVSALRALAADTHARRPLLDALERLGQPLFRFPTPDGYPDDAAPWMGTLLWRWTFAGALVRGEVGGARVDHQALAAMFGGSPSLERAGAYLLGRALTPPELRALEPAWAEDRRLGLALLLASPAFQRH